MKYQATLSFDILYEKLSPAEKAELREYIQEAVEIWGGQRHPDDWLFYPFKEKSVKVTNLKTVK